MMLWALWIIAGGSVNGGYLTQPAPVAYFKTVEECQRVANNVVKLSGAITSDGKPYYRMSHRTQCIQGEYVLK